MNNDETYTPCTSCGRPMAYCKGQCCGKTKGCQCKEYCGSTCAAIRPGEPKCPPQAVIPSLTVESVSNLKDLADCFVHVSDINTTFYIDDKHRIMTTWAGLVSVEDYDFEANPLNLRGQIAYDSKNNVAAIYDKQGANYIFQISDINNDYMLLQSKPQINGVTLEGNKTSADLGIPDVDEVALVFDTVADMKAATNLVDGSYARTLGFHSANDGGGATYYITDSGTPDEGAIIAIGDLRANLIEKTEVTPEMFGAYGDGVHDDVSAIRSALNYLYSTDDNLSGQLAGTLQLNAKTYLVDSSIIDSYYPGRYSKIYIKGNGTRTVIVAGENCTTMFDNQGRIGFSTFDDINFVGNDSTFLVTTGENQQRLRFNRCSFRNFHTIASVQGSINGSEFVFNQCGVSQCGSIENNCELFIFNNSQAVNWRFYATDIETFTGVCFHFLKGTAINYFQGSIIPINGSTVFSYDNADSNSFGGGNYPTATMYGVRYELRQSSKLIDNGSYVKRVVINHIACGMGGQNIVETTDTIKLVNCIPKLTFEECYNFENYKLNIQRNSSITVDSINDGYVKFENCDYEIIVAMIERSTLSASAASYWRMLPSIYFDSQPIFGIVNTANRENLAKYSGQIINKSLTMLTNYNSNSSGAGEKTQLPRSGFITSITLESVYTTNYGSSVQITAEVYNGSDTLIGTGSVTAQSRTKAEIQINAPVTNEWYVLLKNTNGTTWPIPHILYAEYIS